MTIENRTESMIGIMDENLEIQWGYLTLTVVPIICIVGNCMVIAAVWYTKALQTPTNYLLVSLAVADLIIGIFAMPFSIYLSVNSLHWHLPVFVCQFYCTVDVAASTSSIVHMVLISIDRFVAAAKPADYKTSKHRRRTYAGILIAWCFSIILSLPLGTSLNTNTGHYILSEHHCGIYSPIYMFCSSIFAFFIPCFIMVITYGYIFHVLQQRLRCIQLKELAGGQLFGFGADVGNITASATEKAGPDRTIITWEKPFLKSIEESAAEHANSLNDSEREHLQTILEVREADTAMDDDTLRKSSVIYDAVTVSESDIPSKKLSPELDRGSTPKISSAQADYYGRIARSFSDVLTLPHYVRRSLQNASYYTNNNERLFDPRLSLPVPSHVDKVRNNRMRRLSSIITEWERVGRSSIFDFTRSYALARRESFYCARRKLAGLKNWALDLVARLRLKQGVAIRKERRATKLVAIVLAAFLVCWLPFFTLNTVKVYKLMYSSWPTDLEIWFHWFTALGYLNSSLNFFIYFAVNKKFRTTFCRMLKMRRKRKRKKIITTFTRTVTGPKFAIRGTVKKKCFDSINMRRNKCRKTSRISNPPPDIVIQEATNEISPQEPSITNEDCATFRHSEIDMNALHEDTDKCPQMCLSIPESEIFQRDNYRFYEQLQKFDRCTNV